MSDEIYIEGVTYLSSKRAARSSGYTQDYIGQLARGGLIDARRIGNLWYISMDSLGAYKQNAGSYVPKPPETPRVPNPESLLSFDGKDYVSAPRAADITGYHQDYVGQLARGGMVLGRQVGNHWYVERAGLIAHKEEKDGLLGAVQAESVGISRTGEKIKDYNGAEPYLTYTSDLHDLLPNIAEREAAEAETETSIPIRVLRDIRPYSVRMGDTAGGINAPILEKKSKRQPRITRQSLAFLGAAATVVIFLSVGVVSFKNSSVYTQSTEPGSKLTLTASAAATMAKIGDILEQLLTRELVYRRSN